jgi:hypothetical protein
MTDSVSDGHVAGSDDPGGDATSDGARASTRSHWTRWTEARLASLRQALEDDGWTWTGVTGQAYLSDRYEFEVVGGGVAHTQVPRSTEAPDTADLARLAADTLITVSGQLHLELGPMTQREAAWVEARGWHRALNEVTGVPLQETLLRWAAGWRQAGFTPEEAAAWISTVTEKEERRFMAEEFPDKAARWRELGISPQDAARWYLAGYTIAGDVPADEAKGGGLAEGDLWRHRSTGASGGTWFEWAGTRLAVLRQALEDDGWTCTGVTGQTYRSDRYEVELVGGGAAYTQVPRSTEAPDTADLARLAADTLIKVSGQPHLELGPLSEREAAWSAALDDAVRTDPAVEVQRMARRYGIGPSPIGMDSMSSTDKTPTDLPGELARIINGAIDTAGATLPRFGDRRVYIAPLLDLAAEELGVDRDALRLALVEANRRHLLTLARADHVAAMDPELVAVSHIHHVGSDFHFVVDDTGREYGLPINPPSPTRAPPEPAVPSARQWVSTHTDRPTGKVTLVATAEILPEPDEYDHVVTVVTIEEGLSRGQKQTFRDLDFEDACERLDRQGFRPEVPIAPVGPEERVLPGGAADLLAQLPEVGTGAEMSSQRLDSAYPRHSLGGVDDAP